MAVENNKKATGGATGAGWVPGQSGNPGGRPKGLASRIREQVPAGELTDWYVALWTRDEEKLETLGVALKDVTLAERNRAAEWLGDRGYGKAPQYAAVDGDPLELDATERAVSGAVDELVAAREAKASRRAQGAGVAGDGEAGAASA